MSQLIHPNAVIEEGVQLGAATQIWANAQVRCNAVIGHNCIIGKDVYIGAGVILGDNCKIQNGALIYEPATVESGVFVGPGAILTNDHNPRAINPDGSRKTMDDWQAVGVHIKTGASIGAGAICIAPLEIGSWAVIGAGSVVTKSVPDYSLSIGSPARQVGWVSRAGFKLIQQDDGFTCPVTGLKYELLDNQMREVTQ